MQNEPVNPETALSAGEPQTAPAETLPATPAAPAPAKQLSPEELRDRLAIADGWLIALLLVLSFFLGSFALLVNDAWLRLATGRLIAFGNFTFGVDPFSFATSAGEVWVNHSWLFDLIVYGLYQTFGGESIIVLKALIGVGIACVLLQIRHRHQALIVPLTVLVFAMLPITMRLYMRPETVSFLFLAVNVYLLMRPVGQAFQPVGRLESLPHEGEGASTWQLWLVPPLWLLWANLDNWFILGPLVTLLYLVGALISRLSGQAGAVRPGVLAAVFGVGLVACLVNPFHYRVFALPPELAYLVGAANFLPAWLASGGETLAALQNSNAQAVRLLSPWSGAYFGYPYPGGTMAGVLYYPLLLAGLASFALPFVRGGEPGRWPWPRFLLLVSFALLSVVLDQFVAYFAIIAAPCITLNVQEFLRRADWKPDVQSLILARVGAGAVLLLFLVLAWPGWLHTPMTDLARARAERRVCWTFEPDPSLQKTALWLGEQHQNGELRNGYNFNRDLTGYCAWFCADEKGNPRVKGFFDHRYSLFAKTAADYGRMRNRLLALQPQSSKLFEREWAELAERYKIDHLILTGFDNVNALKAAVLGYFWPAERWSFLYGDGRSLVFARSQDKERFDDLQLDFQRLAFGTTPAWQRPPKDGADVADTDFWRRYATGTGERPLAADEAAMYRYFEIYRRNQLERARQYWSFGFWHVLGSAAAAVPAVITLPSNMAAVVALGSDLAPSSEALLATRAARRGIHDNPVDFTALAMLWQATDTTSRQEDNWVALAHPESASVHTFRDELRLVQALTTLHNMARLEPNHPNVHMDLANLYERLRYLDLAHEHLLKAYESLDSSGMDLRQLLSAKKELDDKLRVFQRTIERRHADLDLRSTREKPLTKVFMAFKQQYQIIDQNNRDRREPNMGLARHALTMLLQMDLTKLSAGEKALASDWQMELLMKTGEVGQVLELMRSPQHSLALERVMGRSFFEKQLLAAAAVGDYALADRALKRLEKDVPDIEMNFRVALIRQLSLTNQAPLVGIMASAFRYHDRQVTSPMQQMSDWSLARALLALETGDITQARAAFQNTYRFVGKSIPYPDLAVADRYLLAIRK